MNKNIQATTSLTVTDREAGAKGSRAQALGRFYTTSLGRNPTP